MRNRKLLLALILVINAAVFLADMYLLPSYLLPAAPYAASILLSSYLLHPRSVALVSVFSVAVLTVAGCLHRSPPLEVATSLMSLAVIGGLGTALSIRINREAQLRTVAQTALAKLQLSEERYRRIVETADEGIWIIDAEDRTTFVNGKMAQILGRDQAELEGVPMFDLLDDEWKTAAAANLARLRHGFGERHELRLRGEDGTQVWTSLAATPVLDSSGTYAGSLAMVTDVTAQKQAEALAERLLQETDSRAAQLEATFMSMADAVVMCSPSGQVTNMNAAAMSLLDFTPEDINRTIPEWSVRIRVETPDGKPLETCELPISLALRGETIRGMPLVFRLPNDRGVWTSASAAPVRTQDGALLGAVTIISDVTPLRNLQENLEKLLQMVSHDLRSPLAVIQAHAQVLKWDLQCESNMEDGVRSAEAILRAGRQMDLLIADLVDTARNSAGCLELSRETLDLREFLVGVLHRYSAHLDTGRVKISGSQDLVLAVADADRLERVFTNLLSNALKYSPEGSQVTVRFSAREETTTVSVIDCGRGIDPDDLPHIFERFYQPKGGRAKGSVGLGLFTTKALVEAHGGRIWAFSEPGRGSTFTFTLPSAASLPSARAS
jgi:two-component system, NtrC family, sensor histidine kinase KinB